jgi:hypothetical protein
MNNPTNQKIEKHLVEDCYKLKLAHFPKGFLYFKEIKQGEMVIMNGLSYIKTQYYIKPCADAPQIVINFKRNNLSLSQCIKLESQAIHFGLRPYFLCSCGSRCNILYLRFHGFKFLCRKCNHLTYELCSTINRKARHGELFYHFNRWLKILDMEKQIKRLDYGNKLTRKARELVHAIDKWVINNEVREKIEKYPIR